MKQSHSFSEADRNKQVVEATTLIWSLLCSQNRSPYQVWFVMQEDIWFNLPKPTQHARAERSDSQHA